MRTPFLLLLPAIVVLLVLFVGGLVLGVLQSLGYLPAAGLKDLSFAAYGALFESRGFLRSLGFTVMVSVITTATSVVLAVGTALLLRHRLAGKRLILFAYQLPLTVPYLVAAVGMMTLLSQSGLIARLMFHIGLISEPAQFPPLLHDDLGIGIMLVYLWKQIPFVGLVALAVLQSLGEDYEEQARTLGASGFQAVRHILVPLIVPGIVPASIIIFAFTFGAFEVPLLLGKRFPSMLSVLAYRLYVDVDLSARPQAMATTVFIAIFVLVLVAAYRRLAEGQSQGWGRRDRVVPQ
jgi:putative spermidine/putrescine transport system permease protein